MRAGDRKQVYYKPWPYPYSSIGVWFRKNFPQSRRGHVPYTLVNKRIRLFPKLQGNMRLISNMRLILKGKKLTTPSKPRSLSCTRQRIRQVKRTRKLSVLTWCSPWNLQRVWAVMPWQTLVLVLMRTADVDEESSRRDRRYCLVEIC